MSTPALDRATEEVRQQDAAGPLMRTSVPTRTRAHAIVSAALHDPADPDFGAKVLFRFDYDEEKWGDWSAQFLTVQSVYRERYANLVAAILGEA